MDTFLTELSAVILPSLVALIGTVLTLIINRAAVVARERWGVQIESEHRIALHSAIMSGLEAALSRGLTGKAAIDEALKHAAVSVPDALKKLSPASGVLQSIAEAKLRQISLPGQP